MVAVVAAGMSSNWKPGSELLGKLREDSHTKRHSGVMSCKVTKFFPLQWYGGSPHDHDLACILATFPTLDWSCRKKSMPFLPPSSNSKLVPGIFFNAHNAVDAVRVRPRAKNHSRSPINYNILLKEPSEMCISASLLLVWVQNIYKKYQNVIRHNHYWNAMDHSTSSIFTKVILHFDNHPWNIILFFYRTSTTNATSNFQHATCTFFYFGGKCLAHRAPVL